MESHLLVDMDTADGTDWAVGVRPVRRHSGVYPDDGADAQGPSHSIHRNTERNRP